MERLGRGLVAVSPEAGRVFVSWRLLGTDPRRIGFNLYRQIANAAPRKLHQEPLTRATCFEDREVPTNQPISYILHPVLGGREGRAEAVFRLAGASGGSPWLSIPLQTPPGYTPNDASAGDLDGDGEYEIVLHQAGRGRDNAQRGFTDPPILEAYRLDGAFLWRINLGPNIREGAHYTQFMVYDLDGDGSAEVVCKTADGTVDGVGRVIGNPKADYRNANGYVLDGPEFFTVFEGKTGSALVTTNYLPARGRVGAWGDDYGNRVDRFLACVAYLDGCRPSLVLCRGYYTRAVLAAWDYRDRALSLRWVFDTDASGSDYAAYRGQGNHNLSVGDVDEDGSDEIVYGACCIDHQGRGLYSTGLGHGDALHLSDLDPSRAGLEVFGIHERPRHPHGAAMLDARTGSVLWSLPSPDVARGLASDIDPKHPGAECWAAGQGLEGLYNSRGVKIAQRKPRSCNFALWWDGDLLRELLDRNTISKWDWVNETETRLLTAEGCFANNGTKATPVLSADLVGDWREEVILRSANNRELRVFTTTIPTEHRLPTLMHDPQYRLAVAWQNVGYNQPPHPGWFLGHGMGTPPTPDIRTNTWPQAPSGR